MGTRVVSAWRDENSAAHWGNLGRSVSLVGEGLFLGASAECGCLVSFLIVHCLGAEKTRYQGLRRRKLLKCGYSSLAHRGDVSRSFPAEVRRYWCAAFSNSVGRRWCMLLDERVTDSVGRGRMYLFGACRGHRSLKKRNLSTGSVSAGSYGLMPVWRWQNGLA